MGAISTADKNDLLRAKFGATPSPVRPATFEVHLSTSEPFKDGASGDIVSVTPVVEDGYVPATVSNDDVSWEISEGRAATLVEVSFTVGPAGWNNPPSWAALWDPTSGRYVAFSALGLTPTGTPGEQVILDPGAVSVAIEDY